MMYLCAMYYYSYFIYLNFKQMKNLLSESQIEKIAETVNNSVVSSAEMKDDLIDHLCCMVEDEMSKGKDFETAFNKALQNNSPKDLNEIQNGTVFLFTSKSRKRLDLIVNISGITTLSGILITVVMKMLHLPFAQLVLIATFGVFLLIFFPAFFCRLMKQRPGKKRIPFFGLKGVLFNVGAILCMVSAVFFICHWPYAIIILLLSSILIYTAVFPLFFLKKFKKSR